MDASLYKDVLTSRGLKYHYYFSPHRGSKPTLLFCHGFPSTSRDWRKEALYFQDQGYGIVVPDMLGYGGTDKPTDPALYVLSLMSDDLIDILNAEKLDRVVAIGHDWGSRSISGLAQYYPQRVIAYAFFAVPYLPPRFISPSIDFSQVLADMRKQYGYELFGYWLFFSEDNVNSTIQSHIDSLISLLFTNKPEVKKAHFAPIGALKASLLEDFSSPLASYFTEDDKRAFKEAFSSNGFDAPACWYKVLTRQLQSKDDEKVPDERAYPPSNAPIFFAVAKHDVVCLPENGYRTFSQEAFKDHDITTHEYDADHWLILSNADEINSDLGAWLDNVVYKASV